MGEDKAFYIVVISIVAIIIFSILIPKWLDRPEKEPTREEIINDILKNGNTDTQVLYNGFLFEKKGPLWYSQVQKGNEVYNFGVRYNPYETENITIEGNINNSFRTGELYITFDPYGEGLTYVSLASAELSLNLVRAMGITVNAACMEEHPDCEGRPILTCNSTQLPIIEITSSEETKLVMDGNCMRIMGNEFEILRVTDRVIFTAYGIMG